MKLVKKLRSQITGATGILWKDVIHGAMGLSAYGGRD